MYGRRDPLRTHVMFRAFGAVTKHELLVGLHLEAIHAARQPIEQENTMEDCLNATEGDIVASRLARGYSALQAHRLKNAVTA